MQDLGEVVNNDQHLGHIIISGVVHEVGDIKLNISDLKNSVNIIVVEIDRSLVCALNVSSLS